MPTRLDFTASQRDRLKRLGVIAEQVEALRAILFEIQLALHPHPPLADVRNALAEVLDRAEALACALGKINAPNNEARAEAAVRIATAWRNTRRGPAALHALDRKNGDNSPAHYLIEPLTSLAQAARRGIDDLGNTPRRHRTATVAPIKEIDNALRRGWTEAYGLESETRHRNPYPKRLWPSGAKKSAFEKIAEICYEAVGTSDPSLAVARYATAASKQRKKLSAALYPNAPSKKNRTSRKI